MPPKKAVANGVAKKPRAPKGHVLAAPIPAGELLTDNHKKQWRISHPVGSGGFGLLYLGSKADGKSDDYVIKVEPHANGPLFCELHFYMRVGKPELISKWMTANKVKSLGVPKYIASGAHERNGTKYRFMVMERFGCDLQKLFEQNSKRFPLKTVFQLAIRIIDALEYIHDNEYVHADIKASNLLLGYTPSTSGQVFLVDYGLAFRYCADGKHKEYKEDPRRAHDGTIEFTSTDAHRGVVPSRRGDLEILGYCLLQWLCGMLPWENNLNNKEYVAAQKFRFAKDTPDLMRACFPQGDGPDALRDYMKYVMKLKYDERPNYNSLRQGFRTALKKHSFTDDGKLVFETAAPKKTKAKAAPKAKKAGMKRATSSEDGLSSPEPPKKTSRKAASPTKPRLKSPPAKRSVASPVKRAKVSPVKKTQPSPAARDVAKNHSVPFPPVGAWAPRVKSPGTPTSKKLTNIKTKAKGSRVAKIKEKASVATQTSPGLKGLRRSRKT